MINYTINLDKARELQDVGCEPSKDVNPADIRDVRKFLRQPAEHSFGPHMILRSQPTIWHVLHAVLYSHPLANERREKLWGHPTYSRPKVMDNVMRHTITDESFEQALAYLAAEGYIVPVPVKVPTKVPKTLADIPPGGLTKAQFDRLMIRGWKEKRKGFAQGQWDDRNGNYCAVGVVASELGMASFVDWITRERMLPESIRLKIYDASDSAKTKAEAIRRVKALEW